MCALAPSWLLEKALLFLAGPCTCEFLIALADNGETSPLQAPPELWHGPQSKNPSRLHVITLRLEVNPSEIRENPFKEEVITSL